MVVIFILIKKIGWYVGRKLDLDVLCYNCKVDFYLSFYGLIIVILFVSLLIIVVCFSWNNL